MTDLRNETHKCNRCGAALTVVTVQVPNYQELWTAGEIVPEQVFCGYVDQDVVAECPRCTGGY